MTSQDIKKISYSDYGQTKDIKSGNGYNGETLDQTGLIYLRARYYDPSVSRFVQIDNNYDGEKQSVASQNKYVYTMNNPYKYVDRNGNWSLWGAITNVVKKAVNKVVKTVTKVAKTVVNVVVGFFSPSTAKNIIKAIDNVSKKVTSFVDGIGGNSSNKGGGSKSSKPPVKKVKVEAKCPEKAKSSSNGALDTLQDVLDWIGFLPGIGDICDGINAVISFLRERYLEAAISVACLALPLVADTVLKPLKKIAKSVTEFAQKAAGKVDNIVSGVSKFLSKVSNWIDGCWLIPSGIKKKVCGWLDNFNEYLGKIFKESPEVAAKRARKEAVEANVQKYGKRRAYMGDTPSKTSKTGREVKEKMRTRGEFKEVDGTEYFCQEKRKIGIHYQKLIWPIILRMRLISGMKIWLQKLLSLNVLESLC